MPDLETLFNTAAQFADRYNGSEQAYDNFFGATFAFLDAGGAEKEADRLVDRSIKSFYQFTDNEIFIERLAAGGARIFEHEAVFVPSEPGSGGIKIGDGQKSYLGPIFEPRLQEVIRVLFNKKIFLDDLIIDMGRLHSQQMRKQPYFIITIPRLNAQIALADQYGEAFFVAKPAISVSDWPIFFKQEAGADKSVFSHVHKVTHHDGWEERLMQFAFGDMTNTGKKKDLGIYLEDHGSERYLLTEATIIAMAKLTRERHPQKKWPTIHTGLIDPDIVATVIKNPEWPAETWAYIGTALRTGSRGLLRKTTLHTLLKQNGCSYNLNESMIKKMMELYRERDPNNEWPRAGSGRIDPEIVEQVTKDSFWLPIRWDEVDEAARNRRWGFKQKTNLSKLAKEFSSGYKLTEDMVLSMARLSRETHPQREWPTHAMGLIDPGIVAKITQNQSWPALSWHSINNAFYEGKLGLSAKGGLAHFLKVNGCHYEFDRQQVLEMAELHQQRYGSLPNKTSGFIDRDILTSVTKDPFWREEKWSDVKIRLPCTPTYDFLLDVEELLRDPSVKATKVTFAPRPS